MENVFSPHPSVKSELMKPVSIRIEKPCHEDWDQMTPTEQGRFCGACQKNVIDFSKMTDNELLEFLSTHTGSMCGQLRGSQLNRAITQTRLQGKNWKLNSFFTALMLAGSAGLAMAQTAPPGAPHKIVTATKNPQTQSRKTTDDPISNTLNATVFDTIGNTAMPFATVWIANTQTHVQADANGKFTLIIPTELLTDTISLWIYAPGYMREEYSFSMYETQNISKIELGFEERMEKGEMIIEPPKK